MAGVCNAQQFDETKTVSSPWQPIVVPSDGSSTVRSFVARSNWSVHEINIALRVPRGPGAAVQVSASSPNLVILEEPTVSAAPGETRELSFSVSADAEGARFDLTFSSDGAGGEPIPAEFQSTVGVLGHGSLWVDVAPR
jgi:hypothetical protein